MRRVLTILGTVALVLLGTATPALAKGPDQVTITGPGLAKPVVLGGDGEPGSAGDLSDLADRSGLFVAMFADPSAPSPASGPPSVALGPKYTLVYRVPGGPGNELVRQDLYPAAGGGPLTFTPPGQTVFGGTPVISGWYQGGAGLAALLTALGVPSAPSAPSATAPRAVGKPGGRGSFTPWILVAAAVLVGALVAGGVRLARRR
jgi:hypothetical protein